MEAMFSTTPSYVCPDTSENHWWRFGFRNFFIYNGTDYQNFEEARRKCVAIGSQLAIADSGEVHTCLVQFISKVIGSQSGPPYQSFYIGLKDYTGGNANFLWENGDMLDFVEGTTMQWADGEPNNFNNMVEDCVTMGSLGKNADYKWFDVPCSVKRSYICEKFTEGVFSNEANEVSMIVTSLVVFVILAIIFATLFQERTRLLRRKLPSGSIRGRKIIGWFVRSKYVEEIEKTTESIKATRRDQRHPRVSKLPSQSHAELGKDCNAF